MKYLKFALHKRYFDYGFGILNYVKYVIGFFALASKDVYFTLFLGVGYAVACYILGWYLINNGFWEAENEISNRFNPFQKEVRAKLKVSSKDKRFK